MAYALEVGEELDKVFQKLAKKDKRTFEALSKKITEIVENPYHYKPLKAPMQNKRRVHISGCFVVIFKIESVLRIILETKHLDVPIYTGLWSENLADEKGDFKGRENYNREFRRAIKLFNATQDYKLLESYKEGKLQ